MSNRSIRTSARQKRKRQFSSPSEDVPGPKEVIEGDEDEIQNSPFGTVFTPAVGNYGWIEIHDEKEGFSWQDWDVKIILCKTPDSTGIRVYRERSCAYATGHDWSRTWKNFLYYRPDPDDPSERATGAGEEPRTYTVMRYPAKDPDDDAWVYEGVGYIRRAHDDGDGEAVESGQTHQVDAVQTKTPSPFPRTARRQPNPRRTSVHYTPRKSSSHPTATRATHSLPTAQKSSTAPPPKLPINPKGKARAIPRAPTTAPRASGIGSVRPRNPRKPLRRIGLPATFAHLPPEDSSSPDPPAPDPAATRVALGMARVMLYQAVGLLMSEAPFPEYRDAGAEVVRAWRAAMVQKARAFLHNTKGLVDGSEYAEALNRELDEEEVARQAREGLEEDLGMRRAGLERMR